MGCPSPPRTTIHPPRSVPDPDFTLPESVATRQEQQEGQHSASDSPRVGTSATESENNGSLASVASTSDTQRRDRVTSASPRSSNNSDMEILPQGISPRPSISSTAALPELERYPDLELLRRQVLSESRVVQDSVTKDDGSSESGSPPEMSGAMLRGRPRIHGAGSFTPAA